MKLMQSAGCAGILQPLASLESSPPAATRCDFSAESLAAAPSEGSRDTVRFSPAGSSAAPGGWEGDLGAVQAQTWDRVHRACLSLSHTKGFLPLA